MQNEYLTLLKQRKTQEKLADGNVCTNQSLEEGSNQHTKATSK